jgi:hypothetical protein
MRMMGSLKCLGLGALAAALTLAGCGDDKMGETDEPTAGPSTESPTTNETPTTTAATTEPTTDTTDGPTTEDPTAGPGGMCNPTLQDCPAGQKCVAYDSMAMMYWDANKCVDEPLGGGGSVGDPCNIDEGESVFSGLDNCGKGSICLNFDFSTGQGGTCTAYCGEGNSCGPNEVCVQSANDGVLPICLAACDPLLQDCADMQGCYGDPELDGFICFTPDTGDNSGGDNSPCEFTNACLPGFSCQAAETVEGCAPGSMGCCTPFCSVSGDASECAPSESCVPFYVDPPPGLADVGVCAIPA